MSKHICIVVLASLTCALFAAGSTWAQVDPAAMTKLSQAVPTSGVVRADFENSGHHVRVTILFDFSNGAFAMASTSMAFMRDSDGKLWQKRYDATPAEVWKPTSFPPEAVLRPYIPVALLRWIVQNPSCIREATLSADGSMHVVAMLPASEHHPSYAKGQTYTLAMAVDPEGRVASTQWDDAGVTKFNYPQKQPPVAWVPVANGEAPAVRIMGINAVPAPADLRSYAANMLATNNAALQNVASSSPSPNPQSIPVARPGPHGALILTGSVVLLIAAAAWWKRRA